MIGMGCGNLDVHFISPTPVPWSVERHARARGHPVPTALASWIPAFAGMTQPTRGSHRLAVYLRNGDLVPLQV